MYHAVDRAARGKRMALNIVVDSGETRPVLKEKGESLKLNHIMYYIKDENLMR